MVNGEPFSGRQSVTASFSALTINKLNQIQTKRDPRAIIKLATEHITIVEL